MKMEIKGTTRVSVIIPTYYRYPSLTTVLDLLSRQTRLPDEIVVVDQTPQAERPEGFYGRFPSLPLSIIDMPEPSLSASRNMAARSSSGDVLVFIDDDMEFGPRLLEQHLHVMSAEKVDVVVGAVSTEDTLPATFSRDIHKLDPISVFLKGPNCRWSGMVLITSGANTSMKRDLFLAVGGYDVNLQRMEDIDLGYRLFRHGAKMYYSEKPFSRHMKAAMGGTRRTQPDIREVRLLSRIYLHLKHFPGWTTRQCILREVLYALSFRELDNGLFKWSNLLRFYSPLVNMWRIWSVWREASRRLNCITGRRAC